MSTHKNQSIILNSIPYSSSETKNSRDYCRGCHLYQPSQVGAAGLKRIRYSHICSSYPHTHTHTAYTICVCLYVCMQMWQSTFLHPSMCRARLGILHSGVLAHFICLLVSLSHCIVLLLLLHMLHNHIVYMCASNESTQCLCVCMYAIFMLIFINVAPLEHKFIHTYIGMCIHHHVEQETKEPTYQVTPAIQAVN